MPQQPITTPTLTNATIIPTSMIIAKAQTIPQ